MFVGKLRNIVTHSPKDVLRGAKVKRLQRMTTY